jgi:hypothetical protein
MHFFVGFAGNCGISCQAGNWQAEPIGVNYLPGGIKK